MITNRCPSRTISRHRWTARIACCALAALAFSSTATATVNWLFPGEITVAADGTIVVVETFGNGVYSADPITGEIAVVSGCTEIENLICIGSIVGKGPNLSRPVGIAIENNGSYLVSQPRAVFRVDPITGNREIVSDRDHGTGPDFRDLQGAALADDGSFIVSDSGLDALLRVDPVSGDRSIFTGCFSPICDGHVVGNGPTMNGPLDVAKLNDGSFVLVDTFAIVLRVDPRTGNRTLVSGNGRGAGSEIDLPRSLLVEPDGQIVIVDDGVTGETTPGMIVRIDPATGDRTPVSGCSDRFTCGQCDGKLVGDGPELWTPFYIAQTANGDWLVTDVTRNAILRVDPTDGRREHLSGLTPVASQGGNCPFSFTVCTGGLTPLKEAVLFLSDELGTSHVPAGPCAGVALDVAAPFDIYHQFADANGELTRSYQGVGEDACGHQIQVLDLTTCTVSKPRVFF